MLQFTIIQLLEHGCPTSAKLCGTGISRHEGFYNNFTFIDIYLSSFLITKHVSKETFYSFVCH